MYDEVQTEPQGEVVAVGHVYETGKLMATGGTLIDKPSKLDCKELMMSDHVSLEDLASAHAHDSWQGRCAG